MLKPVKAVICGSRTITDPSLLDEIMETVKEEGYEIAEVVCGGARGADTIGENWARENGIPISYFLPDWKRYGNAAGHMRNHDMVNYADIIIAMWDGQSHGTKGTIDYAMKVKKKPVIVIRTGE